MDPQVVSRLHAAFRDATTDPGYLALLARLGMHSEYQDPEAYAAYLRQKVPEEREFLRTLGALSG
jgi:tripartite-type tricarboxylate transporter receptor subunit TctC